MNATAKRKTDKADLREIDDAPTGKYRLAILDRQTGKVIPVDIWLPARQALSGEYTPRFVLSMLAPGHTDNQ